MARIKKKKYYRILFALTSPLAVGSGENQTTDRDIACDSRGIPYIPGSAMAGMFRHEVKKYEKEYKKYFGDTPEVEYQKQEDSQNQNDKKSESRVITYDATLETESGFVTKRDMVSLNEYKTAESGRKFDFQVLEPGVHFVTFLEQNIYGDDDEHVLDPVIARIVAGEVALGAKTRRGYGHIKAEMKDVKTAVFCMNEENGSSDTEENAATGSGSEGNQDSQKKECNLEEWLKFDIYNKKSHCWMDWEPSKVVANSGQSRLKIELKLTQNGGLSVRQYSTKPGDADYMQMKLQGEKGAWVIPGTTWAGAFRAQLRKLGLKPEELESFFGKEMKYNSERKETTGFRSRISFGESKIEDGVDVVYSRNAIDRFTGGTVDGALYTESIHYNGTTSLEIVLNQITYVESKKDEKKPDEGTIEYALMEKFCKALAASIVDLNEGYLAVGGLTSVGRGLFSVTNVSVNDEDPLEIPYLENAQEADAQTSGSNVADGNQLQDMYQKIYDAIWEVVEKWKKN